MEDDQNERQPKWSKSITPTLILNLILILNLNMNHSTQQSTHLLYNGPKLRTQYTVHIYYIRGQKWTKTKNTVHSRVHIYYLIGPKWTEIKNTVTVHSVHNVNVGYIGQGDISDYAKQRGGGRWQVHLPTYQRPQRPHDTPNTAQPSQSQSLTKLNLNMILILILHSFSYKNQ